MPYSSIPTCYFPSTTLFLDDSRDFLLNFVLQLDESVAYRTFDAPHLALDFLTNKSSERHLFSQQRRHKSNGQALDLTAINAEVYNPHRFSEVSVVVVDYAMPGMDGLTFCRQIENPNIKKILLTGQADEKLAIEAFNEGLIHRYIKKSDVNAAELITSSIYDLQQHYFQAMSDMIVRSLSLTSPRCLYDKKFAQFFRKLCEEKGIVEYYLVDKSGSFFMLDDDANVSFMLVKTAEDLKSYVDWARCHDVSNEVLEPLAKGEKIPGISGLSHDNWHDTLIAAEHFVGDEAYYYAFLQGNVFFDERQQKILSYHRYLEELDAEELLMS